MGEEGLYNLAGGLRKLSKSGDMKYDDVEEANRFSGDEKVGIDEADIEAYAAKVATGDTSHVPPEILRQLQPGGEHYEKVIARKNITLLRNMFGG